jgi:hypothetical protein
MNILKFSAKKNLKLKTEIILIKIPHGEPINKKFVN